MPPSKSQDFPDPSRENNSLYRDITEEEIRQHYKRNLYDRILRWGGWGALLGGLPTVVFLYMDFYVLKIPELVKWRFASIIPAIVFGALLLFKLRPYSDRNYIWARIAHWIMLVGFMTTGFGIVTGSDLLPEAINGLIFISVGVFFLSVGGAKIAASAYLIPGLPALFYIYYFIEPDSLGWGDLLNAGAIMLGGAVMAGVQERFAYRKFRSDAIASFEKEKSDSLIRAMLPESVAAELRSTGKVDPIRYNSASILFADFTNFTAASSALKPEALIAELDLCFSAFDDIVARGGLQKIKTIGDAYMCAGGLPEPSPDHIRQMVQAAEEMVRWVTRRRQQLETEGRPYWNVRVGIHCGEVIAGIIGRRVLSFDVWGDTVNMASRLEHAGEPGRINVSQAVYDGLSSGFECEDRGRIEVKGKGPIQMYFARSQDPADAS